MFAGVFLLQLAVCTFLDATGDRVSTFHSSNTHKAAAHWDSKQVLLKIYQSGGGSMDPAWVEQIVVRRLDNQVCGMFVYMSLSVRD